PWGKRSWRVAPPRYRPVPMVPAAGTRSYPSLAWRKVPMRRIVLVLLAGLLTLGLVPFIPSGEQAAAGDRACFDGVAYCSENAFLAFWQRHGGVEITGLPVSQPFVDDRGLIVQFYERAIMEWHPENEARYQ